MNGPSRCRCQKGLSPVACSRHGTAARGVSRHGFATSASGCNARPTISAAAALTALGSVLGRKIGVAPEQQTDWFEVPNNWGLHRRSPGALKSPAIGEALKPLHRLEVKAREKFEAESVDYGKDLSTMEAAEGCSRGQGQD